MSLPSKKAILIALLGFAVGLLTAPWIRMCLAQLRSVVFGH